MCRRLQSSEVDRARFQANALKQRWNPTAARYDRSMSLAQHRFDSMSKPFCRGTVFFEAYLATCQQMADGRANRQY